MVFKDSSVNLKCSIELVKVMFAFDALHQKITGRPMVVTSVNDGVHKKGSLHYKGLAFDFRIWYLTSSQINDLKKWCDANFKDIDFVREPSHVHIEIDKK